MPRLARLPIVSLSLTGSAALLFGLSGAPAAARSPSDASQPIVAGREVSQGPQYRPLPAAATTALRTALSTADEKERLAQLRSLQNATREDRALQRDIECLLPVVESWAEGRKLAAAGKLAAPHEYLRAAVSATQPPAIREDSPLYPLFCLYRGRHLVWTGLQRASSSDSGNDAAEHYAEARRLFAEARTLVPDNPILNLYLGQPIPWPAPEPDAQAPAWANSQRVILTHLDEIARFWIKERQLPDGSFGGGWAGDAELWREWMPVLLAFENPDAMRAHALFAKSAGGAGTLTPTPSPRPDDRASAHHDLAALEASLARTAEALSMNRAAFTTEVRATDRAFSFTAAYLNTFVEPKLPVPDTRTVLRAVGGETGSAPGARSATVRWLTPPRDIAALVKKAGPRELEAQLYNFSQRFTIMGMETFHLEPGRYLVTLYNDAGEVDVEFPLNSDGTSNKTYFEIAPRTLYTVRVTSEK